MARILTQRRCSAHNQLASTPAALYLYPTVPDGLVSPTYILEYLTKVSRACFGPSVVPPGASRTQHYLGHPCMGLMAVRCWCVVRHLRRQAGLHLLQQGDHARGVGWLDQRVAARQHRAQNRHDLRQVAVALPQHPARHPPLSMGYRQTLAQGTRIGTARPHA